MHALPSSKLASWPWPFEQNQSLMDAWKLSPYTWEFPGYWIDDYFLTAQQYELFESGTINAEAVMIIGNSMDGFLSFMYPDGLYPRHCSDFALALHRHWGDSYVVQGVEKVYPCKDGHHAATPVQSAFWQFALADRDYNIHCPANFLAQTLRKRGVAAWRGTFAVGPRSYDQACLDAMIPCCSGAECYGWASHGAEIPFVFNTTSNACQSESACGEFVDPFIGKQAALVTAMQEYWSSFLATGIPVAASGTGPQWPQAGKGIAILTTPVKIEPDHVSAKCEFWSKYYPGQNRGSHIVV
jgi:carboxylesterase type B